MLAHFWLGAALMLAPVGGLDCRPRRSGLACRWCWAAVLLWVAGFDIIYACQDVDIDEQLGLRSVPARAGRTYGVAAGGAYAIWVWCCCCSGCRKFIRPWVRFI